MASAFEGSNTEFVISVWSKFGFKRDGAFNYTQFRRFLPELVAKSIPSDIWDDGFPHFAADFFRWLSDEQAPVRREDLIELFPNGIVDIEDEILDLSFEAAVTDVNSKKMLYKVWRANKIKRYLEKTTGSRFGAVVRVRPELALNPSIFAKTSLLESRIYVNSFDGRFVGDTFAISSSENMDHYSRLFLEAEDECNKPWPSIHLALGNHLAKRQISIVGAGDIVPPLLDPSFPTEGFKRHLRVLADLADSSPRRSIASQILAAFMVQDRDMSSSERYMLQVTFNDLFDSSSGLWIAGQAFPRPTSDYCLILAGLTYGLLLGRPGNRDNFTRKFMLSDAIAAGLRIGVDLINEDISCGRLKVDFEGARHIIEYGAACLDRLGGATKARSVLASIVSNDTEVARELSVIYYRNSLFERAVETARIAFNRAADSDDLLQHLAFLLIESGQPDEAIRLIDEAKGEAAPSGLILERLRDALRVSSANSYRGGRLSEALELARRAFDMQPNSEDLLQHLAFLLTRSNRADEAVNIINEVSRSGRAPTGIVRERLAEALRAASASPDRSDRFD